MAKKTQEELDAMVGNPVEEVTTDPPAPVSSTPAPPDPWTILDRISRAMEALTARPADDTSTKALEILSAAVQRMSESNIEGAKMLTQEHRRANRPSNEVVPNRSVFNRRGEGLVDDPDPSRRYKKPDLKCMMLLPWMAEAASMTREEVELCNLLEAGSYIVRRQDRTKLTMEVQIRYKADNITPSTLIVNHETAFNNDNFRNMPPLVDMLREMLKQHDAPVRQAAALVMSDEEEEAMIEAGELSVSV
jgi:hypothetical protein